VGKPELKKESINLQEYSFKDADLNDEEYDILSEHFKDYIDVIQLGNGKYRVKAKEYVGNITIPCLNFPRMLAYASDLEPFRKEDILNT